jgi:ATP-dependent helicase/nuclease subunit A
MPSRETLSSRPTYTAQQSAAIAARDFSVALSAGAGCGKTFVLTERFLSHLEPAKDGREKPARLSQLVAITFTERAAREMRDRIRKACYDRLGIREKPGCPEDEVEHWRELLRELDSARISTIHSFCGSLLRSHAVEAGLDPRFRVLDAAESDTLLFELIDRGLRTRLAKRDEDTFELVVKCGLDRLREMVSLYLGSRQNIDWPAWRSKTGEELTAIWDNHFRETVFPQLLQEIIDSPDSDIVIEICRRNPCVCSHSVMKERMVAILETFAKLSDATIAQNSSAVLALVDELREAAKVQGGGTKKHWPNDELFGQFRDAAAGLRKTIDGFKKSASFDVAAARSVAEMCLRLLHLSEEVAADYEREKQSLSVLDFDDLLIHARWLLTGPNSKPLRRRWAEQLRLLLVDEFQDTDPLQVELVKALCDNEVTRGKLFFVGDFKQSIYRFRGADPHVFRLLRDEIPDRGRLPLSENFRSQPGIIEFVNALFSDEFGEGYEPLAAHRKQVTPRPSVEFLWATEDGANLPSPGTDQRLVGGHRAVVGAGGEGGERDDTRNGDDDYSPTERNRRREADWIARRIRAMLDRKETLVGDRDAEKTGHAAAREVNLGDIAILFRALTDVAYYEEALRRYGIDYYLVGGHAFYAQQEVYDLLNLLRALDSPSDDVALVGVLRSPFFCLLDETILWLSRHPQRVRGGLFATQYPPELGEEQAIRARYAADTLGELRAMKDRLPIAQLIRLALDKTAYDAILLTEFLGQRKLANLYKLINQARTFDETGVFSLADFITQLAEFVVRQPKEPLAATHAENMDVVRLMSIHQSKGLEFPVVFVADLERRLGSQSPPAVFSPELGPLVKDADTASGFDLFMRAEGEEDRAETTRLFYVAATRAADYLILSAGIERPKDDEKKEEKEPTFTPRGDWMRLLARHFDLLTGESLEGKEKLVQAITARPEFEDKHENTAVRRNLKTIDDETRKLAEDGEGQWPPFIEPIGADESARQQLSFSRLSGRLHQRREGEAPAELKEFYRPVADVEPTVDPLGLGTLVHAALAEIDLVFPKNIAAIVKRHAAKHVGDDQAAVGQAVEMLERFFASERAKQIAAARRTYRELEFLLAWPPDGNAREGKYFHGYIDLLYQDAAEGWHVLDFKTNLVLDENVGGVAANYELQMLVYALAVEKIMKSAPRELVLHFLRTGCERPFCWNEASQKRVVELVNEAMK